VQHKPLDLLVTVVLANLATSLVLFAAPSGLPRVLLTLPLALALPGYALAAALLHTAHIAGPLVLALAVGLSLACSALLGLALNSLPWGISPGSWAIALDAVTVAASALAWQRRTHGHPAARRASRRLATQRAIALGVPVVAAALALALASFAAQRQPGPQFTELWMLPAPGDPVTELRVGIRNQEQATVAYILVVTMGPKKVLRTNITLAPQQVEVETVTIGPQEASQDVCASLYRSDAPPVVYRRVVWRHDDRTAVPLARADQ
jgi:uncharacterized membrane protein